MTQRIVAYRANFNYEEYRCTYSFLTFAHDANLVACDAIHVVREGGNLLLSGTVDA